MEESAASAFSSLEDLFGGEAVHVAKEMVGGCYSFQNGCLYTHFIFSYRVYLSVLHFNRLLPYET